jgi:hypothetical protein
MAQKDGRCRTAFKMSDVKAGDESSCAYAVPTFVTLCWSSGWRNCDGDLAKGDSAIPVNRGKMKTLPFCQ